MKLTKYEWWRAGRLGTLCWIAVGLAAMTPARRTDAQGVSTTTVQGTVYLANGQAGAGTLVVSWPAFTTATGQAVAADSITATIPSDGFVSVNLAPNVGAAPAGEYYTAVFYMSDGSVSTQYWQVPAGAEATLAQVETQVMPAAQAVQAVSKSYVDESISELSQSLLTSSGGTLSGPLMLNGDPTQELQAATKHYVDTQVATDVPLAGGSMTGALATPAVNGVQAPATGSAQTTLQQAMNAAGTNGAMEIPPAYSGTDTFTNANGVKVTDLRTSAAQQEERSVKEFGAVCDGVTDDTNALQAALNYADTHGVALTIPEGTCKAHSLNWHGESIGGMGKQVSALMGFPGQDVLASMTDSPNLLQYTRLHDLTIYVDQSVDVSCSAAEGRAAAGSCGVSRLMEKSSIFSPGGNGLTGTAGTGAAWAVGNCAIAMPAATGTGGNGLRVAEIENLEIATTGIDPMAGQYPGAHSTHTCGMYLAQWPQWSEFRNIDIRGLNTGVAIPSLPVTAPAGLNADSNRWQNVTIQATHAFTAAAGSNNVLDNVVAMTGNSSAMGEAPTGLVLDFAGTQQGWTVRNAVVSPTWTAVQPALTVTVSGGAVTVVTLGTEHGLGWDPYGTSVPVAFSGSCTAQATATVNSSGAIGSVSVTLGGVGCSSTTTANLNAAGTWDTVAPVNLISGQEMTFFAGNLLKGNGGYTVWNAASSASYGTQLDGGGGTLPGGGSYSALVANSQLGSTLLVDQFPGADIGAKTQACLSAVSVSYGGTCDARNFTGNLSMASNLTISTGNTTILLPCATITTANQVIVTAGTRNVALRGCALRGGSAASGSQGGTAFAYSGTGAMVQVGDPTYATDTSGFHMDNVVINTTAATSASAKALLAYRTQEMDLNSIYLLGNGNQTGMTLDGTGNYTGGSFLNDQIDGFHTAVNAIGHQVTNPATTDWMNASTFVRLHIDCPTSGGSPISGTFGINLQQGDGNTFTGGDVEGCSTALHLGANAQNNTIVGLRNENSTSQVVADAGSSYNNWMTGGTMFTGQLTDNGTRNSFLDTFHRSFNGLNGDWYGSQQDATVTNHYRLGTGAGNERGLLNEIQTDYGYRWLEGYSDATAGEQFYQVEDLLNSVNRLSIGQYNNGSSSTNNQTVINAAGTGAVVLNGSNNAGTGGVVIGSGGTSAATVATISNAGNAQFVGTLQVGSTAQSTGTMTVRNNADAEVDYYLWPGQTTSQKGSFTYKDWNGNSQWYLVKDASNNWALNSAVGGLDSFKAYQSTNSGDTYIDSSSSTGHIRLNYESGSGAETDIYSGSSSNLVAAFLGPTSIKLPGLAAGAGHYCLQIDNSGYLTNTGAACGVSGGGGGTVNTGTSGQIAYYASNGTVVGGTTTVPVTAGGTGAISAAGAVSNLLPGVAGDGLNGVTVAGKVGAGTVVAGSVNGVFDLKANFGASGSNETMSCTLSASNTLTGCSGGDFVVGNTVFIESAGVSPTVSIPSAPTVSCVASGGASCTGSMVYSYEIAAIQGYPNGAVSAASSAGSVTQAAQTLPALFGAYGAVATQIVLPSETNVAMFAIYRSVNGGAYNFYTIQLAGTTFTDTGHYAAVLFSCVDVEIPCTAPSSATPNDVYAQIAGISGSTVTLTALSSPPKYWSQQGLSGSTFPSTPSVSGTFTIQHDDTPAFVAATTFFRANGNPGQVELHIPAGNYNIHEADPINGTGIHLSGIDNLTIAGDGDATKIYQPNDRAQVYSNFFVTLCGDPATTCSGAGLGYPGGYAVNDPVVAGATSATLATPSNISNFSVGQYVTLFDPATGYPNYLYGELNKIAAINTTTGQITLSYPAGKMYSASLTAPYSTLCPACAATPTIAPVITRPSATHIVLRDFYYRGLSIFINYNFVDYLTDQNLTVIAGAKENTGASRHRYIYNEKLTEDNFWAGNTMFTIAAAGDTDFLVTDSAYTTPHMGFTGQPLSENSANISWINNTFDISGWADWVGVQPNGLIYDYFCWGCDFSNNSMTFRNTLTDSVFGSTKSGVTRFRNNRIWIDHVGIASGNSIGTPISGSLLTSTYDQVDNTWQIGSGNGPEVSGNTFTLPGFTSYTLTGQSGSIGLYPYYGGQTVLNVQMSGNITTVNLGTSRVAGLEYYIVFIQPTSGGPYTLPGGCGNSYWATGGGGIDCPGGVPPTANPAASSSTILHFYDDGTTVHQIGANYGSTSSLAVGSTPILGGTNGDIEYNNSGVLGEKGATGSGSVVLAASPTLTTPALGTPASGVITNLTGTCVNCTANAATDDLPLAGGTMTGQIVTDGHGGDILVPAGGSITITSNGVNSQSVSLVSNGSPALNASAGQGFEAYVGSGATNGLYDLPHASPSSQSIMSFAAVASNHSVGTLVAAPAGTIVGTTDTQTLTNKTLDGVTPTTMGYVDPTSSIQTQLNGKAASAATSTFNGSTIALGSASKGFGNVVAQIQLTAQTANLSAATLYTPGSNGYYLLCAEASVTTAATSGSTMPYSQAIFTNVADSNAKYPVLTTTQTGNATYVSSSNCITMYVKASTNIQYQTSGYASSGATAMQYELTLNLISLNQSGY